MSMISRIITVSGGALKTSHKLNAQINFENVDNAQILEWACNDRVIALQRTLRATSDEFITDLGGEIVVHATECGSKIATPAEKIRQLVSAGIPEKLAMMAVMDPNGFNEMMASLE